MNFLNSLKQTTLARKFSLTGKGLHTGTVSTVTFLPAPEDFGYKIKRTDLDGKPVIDASVENVLHSQRCTLLSVDGVQIATLEHALAALYGCGIDNCLIEIDAPEFPILDGSSSEYVKCIQEVGIEVLSKDRIYCVIDHEIEYMDPVSGSYLRILPSDSFGVHVQIEFDSNVLPVQTASLDSLSDFENEISMCRTFVFIKEIKNLLKAGLIKGGDLDNAIVIYDEIMQQHELDQLAEIMKIEKKKIDKLGYIMNRPLIFPNEPARHKLLDLLGDISLVGKFIKGKFIAYRPGHRVNNLFARNIVEHLQIEAAFAINEAV